MNDCCKRAVDAITGVPTSDVHVGNGYFFGADFGKARPFVCGKIHCLKCNTQIQDEVNERNGMTPERQLPAWRDYVDGLNDEIRRLRESYNNAIRLERAWEVLSARAGRKLTAKMKAVLDEIEGT